MVVPCTIRGRWLTWGALQKKKGVVSKLICCELSLACLQVWYAKVADIGTGDRVDWDEKVVWVDLTIDADFSMSNLLRRVWHLIMFQFSNTLLIVV